LSPSASFCSSSFSFWIFRPIVVACTVTATHTPHEKIIDVRCAKKRYSGDEVKVKQGEQVIKLPR
jgi:hypothetical protein